MVLFAVNRSTTEPLALDVDLRGFGDLTVAQALTLSNPDHTWTATVDDSTSVLPRPNTTVGIRGGRARVELPPVSWSMVRMAQA